MHLRKFLSVCLTAAVFFSGCAKKAHQEDKEFTQTPSTTQQNQSQDIFDEFYKDENGSSKDTVAKKETFSTKNASTRAQSNENAKASYLPHFATDGRFVVQISTVRSKRLADNLSETFNSKGYPAYVVEVENPTPSLSGTYYRVRIGAFSGIGYARAFGENILAPSGYEYWIDNKANDNIGIEGNGMGVSGGSNYSEYSAPVQQASQPAPQVSQPAPVQQSQPVAQPVAVTTQTTTTTQTAKTTQSSTTKAQPAATTTQAAPAPKQTTQANPAPAATPTATTAASPAKPAATAKPAQTGTNEWGDDESDW